MDITSQNGMWNEVDKPERNDNIVAGYGWSPATIIGTCKTCGEVCRGNWKVFRQVGLPEPSYFGFTGRCPKCKMSVDGKVSWNILIIGEEREL